MNELVSTPGAQSFDFLWNVLGTYVWPNQFIGQTYDEEYEHLRQWIATRLTWMDGAIHRL